MALTVELDREVEDALKAQSRREGRPVADIVAGLLREHVDVVSRRELIDRVLDSELPRYAEALERLGR